MLIVWIFKAKVTFIIISIWIVQLAALFGFMVEFDASLHDFHQFQGQSAGSYHLFNLKKIKQP